MGAQTAGASLAPVKILLIGTWLNAEGALQVGGNRGTQVQTVVLECGCDLAMFTSLSGPVVKEQGQFLATGWAGE